VSLMTRPATCKERCSTSALCLCPSHSHSLYFSFSLSLSLSLSLFLSTLSLTFCLQSTMQRVRSYGAFWFGLLHTKRLSVWLQVAEMSLRCEDVLWSAMDAKMHKELTELLTEFKDKAISQNVRQARCTIDLTHVLCCKRKS